MRCHNPRYQLENAKRCQVTLVAHLFAFLFLQAAPYVRRNAALRCVLATPHLFT